MTSRCILPYGVFLSHSHSCGLPAASGLGYDSCVVADMVCALWHLSQQKPTPLGKKKCLRKFCAAIWRTSPPLPLLPLCPLTLLCGLQFVPTVPVSQHMSKRSCHPPVAPRDGFLHPSIVSLLPHRTPLCQKCCVCSCWLDVVSALVIIVKLAHLVERNTKYNCRNLVFWFVWYSGLNFYLKNVAFSYCTIPRTAVFYLKMLFIT